MIWIPNEQEIEAVLSLVASKRYEYCLKKVVDLEEVWSLWQNGGWALAGDDAGRLLVPFWPHSKYAELCVDGIWAGYNPQSIPLDAWISRWIPGMERDQRLVAIFPTPLDKGISIEPSRLEHDLLNELSKYE